MAEDKVDNSQVEELVPQGSRSIQVNLSSVSEKVQVFKLGQKTATSLSWSPESI